MQKVKSIFSITIIFSIIALAAACGGAGSSSENKVIKSGTINNLTVSLLNDTGKLKNGDQELMLEFKDSLGKTVDVGAASLNFNMPAMGAMAEMNDPATLMTTSTPGVYKGKVKIEMPGEWIAQITIDGTAGKGKTSFPLTAY
jgi:hypothetical protein